MPHRVATYLIRLATLVVLFLACTVAPVASPQGATVQATGAATAATTPVEEAPPAGLYRDEYVCLC